MPRFQGLQIRPVQESHLDAYCQLLKSSFTRFVATKEYLRWLYYENPRGEVKGFDAFDGNRLVAHYACIPTKINSFQSNSLLSLNTATHPNYRGQGLFKFLASTTFESVANTYANVIGVANANSVTGFTKNLGFEKLGNLELRYGLLPRSLEGSRIYSKEELDWRTSCPDRQLKIRNLDSTFFLISRRINWFLPELKAIVSQDSVKPNKHVSLQLGMTLDWRRGKTPIVKLPEFLKPSPLVLIFKPLLERDSTKLTSFSFPDFDAF